MALADLTRNVVEAHFQEFLSRRRFTRQTDDFIGKHACSLRHLSTRNKFSRGATVKTLLIISKQ